MNRVTPTNTRSLGGVLAKDGAVRTFAARRPGVMSGLGALAMVASIPVVLATTIPAVITAGVGLAATGAVMAVKYAGKTPKHN